MRSCLKNIRLCAAVLATVVLLSGLSPTVVAFAQTMPAPAAATLSEAVIKALQEALTQQGIAVKVDGLLSEETRTAIRTYQSQHHLPVTGEPDKATLDKLGVRQSAAPAEAGTTAQTTPATPPAGSSAQRPQMPGGMMMSGPMMQGMMQGMMQTMQGMMGMMQGQMQPGMQPGPMRSRQPQSGMNCPMMPGASQESAPAMMQMMQMMQGMMQMMQLMQGQMQPGQMPPNQK